MAAVRNTRQRQVIRRVFEDEKRPLTAGEAVSLSRMRVHSIGTATVYRAINRMVEDGLLVPVEIPAETTRYEIAGLHHHHHFCCRVCKKVYDVEGCPSDFEQFTPAGFELDAHEVILYGRCEPCVNAS